MLSLLKAMIVVAGVSVLVLAFFRKPFADVIGDQRYLKWALLWLSATVLAFLIGNFWAYCVLLAALALAVGLSEPVKPAIFALLFLAAPPATTFIPGFAGINKFIDLSPQLVLVLVFLLPLMIFSSKNRKDVREGGGADFFIIGYLLVGIMLAIREPSVTHAIRVAINGFLLVGPAYFIASRHPKSLDDIRVLSAAIVLPALILSAVAFFEFGMRWHFFNHITSNWGLQDIHGYKFREGFLRAYTSTENSVSWGMIAMTSFGVGLAFFNDRMSPFFRLAGLGLLSVGLLVSLSRGPWVGAGLALTVFVMTSPQAMTRMVQLSVFGVIAFGVAAVSPFGQTVIGLLPFIGDSASETISYRQQLLTVAMDIVRESPWIGHANFRAHPSLEVMRQGEGIIDIVNTYVNVALSSGMLGLFFFVGGFLAVLMSLRKAMRRARTYSPEIALYARAYFATTIAVMFAIFTTSSISPINFCYWLLLGGAIGVVRMEARAFAGSGEAVNTSFAEKDETPAEAEAFAWK